MMMKMSFADITALAMSTSWLIDSVIAADTCSTFSQSVKYIMMEQYEKSFAGDDSEWCNGMFNI